MGCRIEKREGRDVGQRTEKGECRTEKGEGRDKGERREKRDARQRRETRGMQYKNAGPLRPYPKASIPETQAKSYSGSISSFSDSRRSFG